MGTMFTNTPTTRFESWKRVAGCFLLVSATLLCIGCIQPNVPSRRKLIQPEMDSCQHILRLMQDIGLDHNRASIEDLITEIREESAVARECLTHTVKADCMGEAHTIIDELKDPQSNLAFSQAKINAYTNLVTAFDEVSSQDSDSANLLG